MYATLPEGKDLCTPPYQTPLVKQPNYARVSCLELAPWNHWSHQKPSCLREPVQGKGWIFQTNVAAAKADEHADTAIKHPHMNTNAEKTGFEIY